MDLPVVVALAVAAAVVTLLVCDLVGSTARAKGRSYWLWSALGLLLWFPALIAVLLLPAREPLALTAGPGRLETALGVLLVLAGAATLAVGAAAAVAYAP